MSQQTASPFRLQIRQDLANGCTRVWLYLIPTPLAPDRAQEQHQISLRPCSHFSFDVSSFAIFGSPCKSLKRSIEAPDRRQIVEQPRAKNSDDACVRIKYRLARAESARVS